MTTDHSAPKPISVLIVPLIMILLIVAYRLGPHPQNLTPIGALFVLSGLYLSRGWKAWVLPFAAIIASDVSVYLQYDGSWMQPGRLVDYLALALVLLAGRAGAFRGLAMRIGAVLSAPLIFFFVSNFGVWLGADVIAYPHTFSGLVDCYVAALPFFRGTLVGDWLFGLGGLAVIEGLPWLRRTHAAGSRAA
jgi:hypothetical protein